MTRVLRVMSVVLALWPLALQADPAAVRLVNDFRDRNGLPALEYDENLEQAARLHAQDMLATRHFSHTGSDGSSVADRVSRTGYRWCFVAENIAQGQRDLAEVVSAWAQSPGHRANILSPRVQEFALIEGPGYIWVMVLAATRC